MSISIFRDNGDTWRAEKEMRLKSEYFISISYFFAILRDYFKELKTLADLSDAK